MKPKRSGAATVLLWAQKCLQWLRRFCVYLARLLLGYLPQCENLQEKCRAPKPLPTRTTLCASLGGRNACQDFTRAALYRNLQEECCAPKPRPTLCASLRRGNALQHFIRDTLCRNIQEKYRAPKPRPTLCAGLRRRMHFNISQEPLYMEICRKKTRGQSEHPDQAPAFTLAVRTP